MKKLKEKICDYIIYPRATKQEESNQLNRYFSFLKPDSLVYTYFSLPLS